MFIRPNGPVPVIALEWRIKVSGGYQTISSSVLTAPTTQEDVPVNLRAVKAATESLADRSTTYWEATETLGLYIDGMADE